MKGSLRIARIAGIGVYVHWTFLVVLSWIFVAQFLSGGLADAFRGLGLILSLFVCVVLHEFGHALVARRFNVPTKDITLLPIGGVARMERIPRNPNQELAIAVAGPAVNVVIAAVLYALIYTRGRLPDIEAVASMTASWVDMLLWFNIVLVLFNLLPAFPMDGGRVLRSLLARRIDYVDATMVAASIGQAMAVGFLVVGLFSNWVLMLVAVFVYLGARAEADAVRILELVTGATAGDAMEARFNTLDLDHTLDDASELLLSGSQNDFPVLDNGRLVGMLYRSDLFSAVANHCAETPVRQIMRTDFKVLSASDDLESSLTAFQTDSVTTIPVIKDGELAGILTQENIAEWMTVGSAKRKLARKTGPNRSSREPSRVVVQANRHKPSTPVSGF